MRTLLHPIALAACLCAACTETPTSVIGDVTADTVSGDTDVDADTRAPDSDARDDTDAPNVDTEDVAPDRDIHQEVTDDVAADVDNPDVNDVSSGDASPDGEETDVSYPDGPGPYALDGDQTFENTTAAVANGSRRFTEHIYVPNGPGQHPVVVFAPGTQQPVGGYVSYYERLASHGFVVLSRDDAGPLVGTPVLVDDLTYLVQEWLPAQNDDPESPLYQEVDLTRIGLAGHSRGGKATLLAAETNLRDSVDAWFGIDFVDATFIDDGVYAATELHTLEIPTVFLAAAVPTSCSPANSSSAAVYPRAPAPSVLITAIGASHTDFEDPAGCVLCTICTPGGTADAAEVRDFSRRYLTAFFARELLRDASVGPAFEGAGVSNDVAEGRVTVQSR